MLDIPFINYYIFCISLTSIFILLYKRHWKEKLSILFLTIIINACLLLIFYLFLTDKRFNNLKNMVYFLDDGTEHSILSSKNHFLHLFSFLTWLISLYSAFIIILIYKSYSKKKLVLVGKDENKVKIKIHILNAKQKTFNLMLSSLVSLFFALALTSSSSLIFINRVNYGVLDQIATRINNTLTFSLTKNNPKNVKNNFINNNNFENLYLIKNKSRANEKFPS